MPIQGISAGHLVISTPTVAASAPSTSDTTASSSSASQATPTSAPPSGGRPSGPPPGGGPSGPPPGGAPRESTSSTTSSSSSTTSTDEITRVARQMGISADALRSTVQQLKSVGQSADPLADAIQRLQEVKQAEATGESQTSQQTTRALPTTRPTGDESFNRMSRQMGVEPSTLRTAIRAAIDQSTDTAGNRAPEPDARRIVGVAAQAVGLEPTALVTAIQQYNANLINQYA